MSKPIARHADGTDCYTPNCKLGVHTPIPSLSAGFDEAEKRAKRNAPTAAQKKKWAAGAEAKESKVKALLEELQGQVENLANDETWIASLNIMGKFHSYSFRNQMLIALQKPDATRVAGFNRWKELGRSVNRGEKAITIIAPAPIYADVVDDAGNAVLGDDGKKKRTVVSSRFTTAAVFDISQTSGEPLPHYDRELKETPPEGFEDDLTTAIQDKGFTVSEEELQPGHQGYTTTDGSKRVVIAKGLNPAQRAETLAHELGHIAAGHIDRAGEYHTGHGGQRSNMEVEAQSISYVLVRANGMSPAMGRSSAPYVAGWGSKDPDALKNSGTAVSKAVKGLLGEHAWRNLN